MCGFIFFLYFSGGYILWRHCKDDCMSTLRWFMITWVARIAKKKLVPIKLQSDYWLLLRKDSQTQRGMLIGDILISVCRWSAGSRWVMGLMILWRVMSRSDRWYPSRSRRSWMETDAGDPGLEQEGESERRRTEDEDEEDTLRMTQKVCIYQYVNEVNRVVWC